MDDLLLTWFDSKMEIYIAINECTSLFIGKAGQSKSLIFHLKLVIRDIDSVE